MAAQKCRSSYCDESTKNLNVSSGIYILTVMASVSALLVGGIGAKVSAGFNYLPF